MACKARKKCIGRRGVDDLASLGIEGECRVKAWDALGFWYDPQRLTVADQGKTKAHEKFILAVANRQSMLLKIKTTIREAHPRTHQRNAIGWRHGTC